jgi:outer membrane protein OmpA-like peptidoglycan-associated protein
MKKEEKANPFGLSIGDLMAALLLLFVLLLMGVLLQLQEQVDQQNVVVDQFDNLNEELYEDLLVEFKDDLEEWHATIIDTTLSIRFEEPRLLFDDGEALLKDTFQLILNDFFPRYLSVIQKEKYVQEISEIRIEGHTSSTGSGTRDYNYLLNVGLSQNRAKNTLAYLFTIPVINESQKIWCIDRLTANGLSWSKLVYKDNGEEDIQRSRRVEFRVKIDAEKKLRALSKLLK